MSKTQRKPNKIIGVDRILKSISPVMKMENIYGLFRYRLLNGKLTPIRSAFKIYGIIIMCIFVIPFVSLFIYYSLQIDNLNKEMVIILAQDVSIFIMAIQYIVSMIIFIRSSERNIRLIKVLAKIDNKLQVSHNRFFFKNTRQSVQLLMLFFVVLYGLSSVPQFTEERTGIIYHILVIAIDFERHMEIFVLCIFVKILIDRLNVLNNYLLTFLRLKRNKCSVLSLYNTTHKNYSKSTNYIGKASESNFKIRHLATAFDDIGEVKSLINEIFDFQIFMSLLSTFIFIIIMVWTSIYYFPSYKSSEIIDISSQCAFEILSIGFMSYICEVMNLKRDKTKILVNEIVMDYELPKSMRIQAKAFMELIQVWPLNICTYDMFTIDVKLMIKFISISTTYIIVVIQISHIV